ncbi:sodium:solute symporter family protein [Methylocaldum sp.]|uniref:sodium:solute symporter family protein n=1 Tax=Methylocaldum sp. TaxID=1969727 RepID=UPI002D4329E8|nr:sodium:solute symporter family protein [Methylocaldum sp.]HYE36376.1 sodium:solute symporter family protein [Methylocaldum sp.]
MNVVLLGIVAYILVQLLIGMLVSRRISSEDDYLLAGRRLGLKLGTFTVFATWFGAETCIGAAGSIYQSGLSGGSADPFGYAACLLLMGLFFAVPLWRRKLTTLADLFRIRYSPKIERLAVLMLAPTSIMWAAAQIRAFGQVISASSDFEVEIAITIAAAVVIIYTVYGGLFADVITDLVQGIALILGLGVLFYFVTEANGGFLASFEKIDPARLKLFGGSEKPLLEVIETWAIPITGSLFAQELCARILASRSQRVARASCLAGGGLYLLVGLMPVFIGLLGVQLLPGLEDPEQILPKLAQQHLSTFAYVLFAGALISAILSTVDSALLAASALVSHNLVIPLAGTVSEQGKVRIARTGVLIFGIVAYVLALYADGVHELVEEASAFGGAAIFVVILLGLFTRIGHAKSAAAALIVGMIAWLVGSYAMELATPYLASLVASLLAYLIVAAWESRTVNTAAEASI